MIIHAVDDAVKKLKTSTCASDAIPKVLGPERSGLGIGTSPSRKFGRDSCLGTSKKKLLIFDINGVLADVEFVCTSDGTPEFSPKPDMILVNDKNEQNKQLVYMRKNCHEFLEFCFENFVVAIWSSKERINVKKLVDFLFKDRQKELLFFWDRLYCTKSTLHVPTQSDKKMVFKDLNKVWDQFRSFSAKNTLLVDDSPYKALLNPPHTAIFPHTYKFWHKTDNSIGKGGGLRVYLEKLVDAVDAQKYVMTNQFGQPNIKEQDKYWGYYKNAIDEVTASVTTRTSAPPTEPAPDVDAPAVKDTITGPSITKNVLEDSDSDSKPISHSIKKIGSSSQTRSAVLTAPSTKSKLSKRDTLQQTEGKKASSDVSSPHRSAKSKQSKRTKEDTGDGPEKKRLKKAESSKDGLEKEKKKKKKHKSSSSKTQQDQVAEVSKETDDVPPLILKRRGKVISTHFKGIEIEDQSDPILIPTASVMSPTPNTADERDLIEDKDVGVDRSTKEGVVETSKKNLVVENIGPLVESGPKVQDEALEQPGAASEQQPSTTGPSEYNPGPEESSPHHQPLETNVVAGNEQGSTSGAVSKDDNMLAKLPTGAQSSQDKFQADPKVITSLQDPQPSTLNVSSPDIDIDREIEELDGFVDKYIFSSDSDQTQTLVHAGKLPPEAAEIKHLTDKIKAYAFLPELPESLVKDPNLLQELQEAVAKLRSLDITDSCRLLLSTFDQILLPLAENVKQVAANEEEIFQQRAAVQDAVTIAKEDSKAMKILMATLKDKRLALVPKRKRADEIRSQLAALSKELEDITAADKDLEESIAGIQATLRTKAKNAASLRTQTEQRDKTILTLSERTEELVNYGVRLRGDLSNFQKKFEKF